MSAGDDDHLHHPAGRRRLRRPRRRGGGDRPHGQGEASCPSSTTSSPSWPASSTRSTSCAATCASGSARVQAGRADLRRPGQGPGGSWSRPPRCRRRRASSARRSRAASRRWSTSCERIGASLEDYLAAEEQDRGADRRRADRGGRPRASRSSCCWTPSPTPRTSRSPTTSSGTRSCTGPSAPGWPPQQYYDQLVRSGAAGAVFGDVRRGKALASVMEQVKIKDTAGNAVALDDAAGRATSTTHDHDHEH